MPLPQCKSKTAVFEESYVVAGSISFAVSDVGALLADPAAKAKTEKAVRRTLATQFRISDDSDTLIVELALGRRLAEEPPARRLQAGALRVDYTISAEDAETADRVKTE